MTALDELRRQFEGVSTKHPKDIVKMLRVVGNQLDIEYLNHWAETIGVSFIWQVIWDEHRRANPLV